MTFHANLAAAGVADRVEHVRRFSDMAHGDVDGPIDLLHVDGAHRYAPARDDIAGWGARVRPGGANADPRLVQLDRRDRCASCGCSCSRGRWRYLGRAGSLADYRREDLRGAGARVRNALRQLAQLPWFARNVAVKVAADPAPAPGGAAARRRRLAVLTVSATATASSTQTATATQCAPVRSAANSELKPPASSGGKSR